MMRVREHDEAAFETLMRRHEERVFMLAFRVLGSREEARDLAQELFIALWENPRAWKPTALFTTWLHRVTLNRALNRLRMLKVKLFLRLSDYDPDELPIPDPSPNPEQQVTDAERQQAFEAAFRRLPPRQRAALHLRYREELPVAEVARALGVSLKSAESLIFRGKQALRNEIR